MDLRSCGQCRRHVDTTEARCPFCRAVLAPAAARAVAVGRLGRAAVFASATLASGCWTSSPPKQTTPIEDTKTVEPTTPAIAAGEIRGIVRDARSGAPLAGYRVLLVDDNTGARQQGLTDDHGEYVFSGLAPGAYSVRHEPAHPRQAPAQIHVELAADAGQRADLSIHMPATRIDHNNVPMPYGAPPARRRVV